MVKRDHVVAGVALLQTPIMQVRGATPSSMR
jgi:hypothetical protein